MALNLSFLTSRGFNNFRATLYTATPLVLAVLVNGEVMTQDRANLWLALVLAVLSPALAAKLTADRLRTWFFGVVAALQALMVGLGIGVNQHVTLIVAVINAVVVAAIATANVHDDNTGGDTATGSSS